MTAEELARLVDAYRDGSISVEDAEALAAAIRADKSIAREFQFEGILAEALEKGDEEAFLRSFRERLAAEREGTAFLRAFERRRLTTRRASPSSSWGVPAAFAAGILFAILVYWVSTSKPAETQKVAEKPVRVELQDVAPPPPPPPPPPPLAPEAPKVEVAPPRETPRPLPAPVAPVPEPVVPPPPPPVEPKLAPKEPAETRVAIVTVLAVQGDVFRLDGAARTPLADAQGVMPGQGIECAAKAFASVVYPDGTRMEVGADTIVRDISDKKGKRVSVVKGTLTAQVAKQPADAPMIFATPHGEARVVGTALRLDVDQQTRLEVMEGKVRLTRAGGKSADVAAGNVASCGPGLEPVARAVHPDDIVLLPQQAKLVGDEWRLAADRNASTGVSLEVAKSPFKPVDHVENRPSYALFTFQASAEKEYRLWLRASSSATGDKWTREMVTLEPLGCTLTPKSPFFGAAPTTAYVFTGLANYSGYAWSSGSYDEARPDAPPLVVRFKSTGMQTLRLYTVHPSIHIDSIWLSSRQLTRPAPKSFAPPEGR